MLILQAGLMRVSCFASSDLLERVISRLGYLFSELLYRFMSRITYTLKAEPGQPLLI